MAQAKYYKERGSGREVWSDILHPPDQDSDHGDIPLPSLDDDISLQSCPVNDSVVNPQFSPHHKRTQSACGPIRPPRSHRPLSHQHQPATPNVPPSPRPLATPPPFTFSSSPFLSSSRLSLASSQQSLVPQSPPMPRPKSLYVPFMGCVDAPRAPPGRAARDILNAMSYAPTQDSFSSQSSDNQSTPRSNLYKSPKLRSKSSSLASLLTPKMSRRQETSELFSSTSSLVHLHQLHSPNFSPCHPMNNCENSCLKVSHPPVLHPPPDLVQMASLTRTSSTHSPPSSRSSSRQSPLMFEYQNPSLMTQSSLSMIREASPYNPSP